MVVWLEDVRRDDVARVGRKNASLGELTRGLAAAGVRVPPGFATTADAFRGFGTKTPAMQAGVWFPIEQPGIAV